MLYGHYSDVIMSVMVSQLTGVSIVYSTVYSQADQRKHQSPASLAFVRRIHRLHKGPVTRNILSFYDVITVNILAADGQRKEPWYHQLYH